MMQVGPRSRLGGAVLHAVTEIYEDFTWVRKGTRGIAPLLVAAEVIWASEVLSDGPRFETGEYFARQSGL